MYIFIVNVVYFGSDSVELKLISELVCIKHHNTNLGLFSSDNVTDRVSVYYWVFFLFLFVI